MEEESMKLIIRVLLWPLRVAAQYAVYAQESAYNPTAKWMGWRGVWREIR